MQQAYSIRLHSNNSVFYMLIILCALLLLMLSGAPTVQHRMFGWVAGNKSQKIWKEFL